MDPRDNDAELLQALIRGEDGAYRIAVRRYSAGMLATARALVDASTAEDVVQEAWVAVIDVIAQFEQRCTLQTWLNTITANRAKSRLRRSWREVNFDFQPGDSGFAPRFDSAGRWRRPPVAWDAVSPDLLIQGEELRECLNQHLAALPDNLQAVLVMRDLLQLDSGLICNTLDISASNLRVLLHRARQRIYLMLETFEETGEC